MKNAALLILTAAGVAVLAWGFWHFLGNSAFNVISAMALVAITVDNIRLRRQLRSQQLT